MFMQSKGFRRAPMLAACLLAACAAPTTLVESPSIRLTNIRTGHLSFDHQSFMLEFDISNPNAFPLPIRALRYDLQIAEQRFASGETQAGFTVPAGGDGSFAVSVDLDMLQQASRLATMLRVGSRSDVAYKLNGSIAVDIPFTKPVPFSTSGSISLTNSL